MWQHAQKYMSEQICPWHTPAFAGTLGKQPATTTAHAVHRGGTAYWIVTTHTVLAAAITISVFSPQHTLIAVHKQSSYQKECAPLGLMHWMAVRDVLLQSELSLESGKPAIRRPAIHHKGHWREHHTFTLITGWSGRDKSCVVVTSPQLRGLFNLRCHHSLKKRTSHLSNLKLLHPLEVFSVGSDAKFKPPTPILKRPLVVGFRQTGQLWSYGFGEVLYPVKLTPSELFLQNREQPEVAWGQVGAVGWVV